MELPIDTSRLAFTMVGSPRPVRDFRTGQAKGDKDGMPLFSVRLLVALGDDGEVVAVKVAGEPVGLVPNAPVRVTGLTVLPWSVDGKSGVAYRAVTIEPAAAVRNGAGA